MEKMSKQLEMGDLIVFYDAIITAGYQLGVNNSRKIHH
jgi:hypothetical protein